MKGTYMNMYKIYNKVKILLLIMLILPLLNACRIDEADYELTNYTGKSTNTFEKRTRTELTQESNGVYKIEGSLQLIAPKGSITSFTILEGSQDYRLFGVGIGYSKDQAEEKLIEVYGPEANKTLESEKNSIIHTYRDNESELYLSYDIDREIVTEISYYYLKTDILEDEEDVNSGELIALVGDTKVYYNEAMVYLKSAQENYEVDYGKDIWDVDIFGDGGNFGEYIKNEVLKQITQLKVIGDKARQEAIALTEEERADASAYAAIHFSEISDVDRDRYLVTQELLERVYSDNLLAEKVFETLTIDVDTNVPDVTARQITVQHILVYNTELNEKGKRVPLSTEKREGAYDKVNALLERARNGEDFYTLAETNSEDDVIVYTFGRGEGPEEFSSVYEQAAFNLKSGEISDIISTDYGWHIIYCVTDFNEDATTRVKEAIIEQRRTEQFAKHYTQWSSEYDLVVNSDVWDSISLK